MYICFSPLQNIKIILLLLTIAGSVYDPDVSLDVVMKQFKAKEICYILLMKNEATKNKQRITSTRDYVTFARNSLSIYPLL